MKIEKTHDLFSLSWFGLLHLLAMLCLVCPWAAEATAPRVTAKMFGEEKRADIVGYQLVPLNATATNVDGKLSLEIVTEAFKASGKAPTVDILPSKELAKYALVNNDAAALIGSPGNLTAEEKNQYNVMTFYLSPVASGEQQFSLIVSKKHVHGKELQLAFNEGLKTIIKTGKYLEILEKHLGKGKIPSDYASQLKRYNHGLK